MGVLLSLFAAAPVAGGRWWQVRTHGIEPPYPTEDDPAWLAHCIDRK